MSFKTAGIEFIRNEVSGIAWDKYDPWACVMNALFDVCEAWWHATGLHTDGYEPSAAMERMKFDPEDDFRVDRMAHAMQDGLITPTDVAHWITVLMRMHNLVIKAGRNY